MRYKTALIYLGILLCCSASGGCREKTAEALQRTEVQEESEYIDCLKFSYDDFFILLKASGEAEAVPFPEEFSGNTRPIYMDGDAVYYVINQYEEESDSWKEIFYKWDKEKGHREVLAVDTAGSVYPYFQDGKIYILNSEYDSAGNLIYTEKVYESQADETYLEKEENQQLYDSMRAQGYEVISCYYDNGSRITYSVPYCLANFGQIIAWDEDQCAVVFLNEDGTVLNKVVLSGEFSDIEACNEKYIAYLKDVDTKRELVLYLIDTQKEIVLQSYDRTREQDNLSLSALACEKEQFIYSKRKMISYSIYQNDIYCYDVNTGEEKLLYTTMTQPGTGWYYDSGVSGFKKLGDYCYFLYSNEKETAWYRLSLGASLEEKVPLGIVSEQYNYPEYGKVLYENDCNYCPACGKRGSAFYLEYFQFDPSWPGAEKMNQSILEDMKKNQELMPIETEEELKENHEVHEEWPLAEDFTRKIDSLEPLGNQWVEINYNDYYYSGGAHGMPDRQHVVYDLMTGEKVGFKHFYTGTLEDFKRIAAEYSIAYWKENTDLFFGYLEEELYESIYEYADYDMLMKFSSDSIIIEYPPYLYGPYAAGFISVEIPYEELGITFR